MCGIYRSAQPLCEQKLGTTFTKLFYSKMSSYEAEGWGGGEVRESRLDDSSK